MEDKEIQDEELLEVNLNYVTYDFKEIGKIIEEIKKLQKEHNCHCTLNVVLEY